MSVEVVTFCGHGDCHGDDVRRWLQIQVEKTIEEGADLFYLGGYGGFDRMAASVVWELKREHPEIQSVLVLPYLDRKVNTEKYDGTTYPPLESVPKRFAISRRNQWMVDQSDVVIAYVLHDWGGAATTLDYARRKHKIIFNYGDSDTVEK
jgi:uncharacterized phage-like protein YoqJ